jgi:hypothetical protein
MKQMERRVIDVLALAIGDAYGHIAVPPRILPNVDGGSFRLARAHEGERVFLLAALMSA